MATSESKWVFYDTHQPKKGNSGTVLKIELFCRSVQKRTILPMLVKIGRFSRWWLSPPNDIWPPLLGERGPVVAPGDWAGCSKVGWGQGGVNVMPTKGQGHGGSSLPVLVGFPLKSMVLFKQLSKAIWNIILIMGFSLLHYSTNPFFPLNLLLTLSCPAAIMVDGL